MTRRATVSASCTICCSVSRAIIECGASRYRRASASQPSQHGVGLDRRCLGAGTLTLGKALGERFPLDGRESRLRRRLRIDGDHNRYTRRDRRRRRCRPTLGRLPREREDHRLRRRASCLSGHTRQRPLHRSRSPLRLRAGGPPRRLPAAPFPPRARGRRPMTSISSRIISAARFDMLSKMR